MSPVPPLVPENRALTLEALLGAHAKIYKADSEKRLVAWLRHDLLSILSCAPHGAAGAGQSGYGQHLSPPSSISGKQDDPKLSADEVAARLRLTKKTLGHWRAANKGPRGFKMGQSV